MHEEGYSKCNYKFWNTPLSIFGYNMVTKLKENKGKGINTMNKKRKSRNNRFFLAITLPAVALFTIFFTVPAIQGIYYSLTDWNGLSKTYSFIGISNYLKIFRDGRVLNSIGFTARYTILLVIGVIILAMGLALILTYVVSQRFKTIFRSIFFFPAVLSLITVGLIWNEIFYRVIPQVGEWIGIGWLSKNILGDVKMAIYGVLLVNIWQGTSIPFVMLLAGIQNVPKDLQEAAVVDGATPWQIFRKITIPFLLPTINVAFVLTLKNGITVFDYIQAMTTGGPARATESTAFLIYKLSFMDAKMSYAMAISFVLLAAIIVISMVQMKVSAKYEVGQV